MLLSYRWLKKIANLQTPVAELGHCLTMAGMEVEDVRDFGYLSGKMLIGKIVKVEPHPKNAKLTVCQTSIGERGMLQIVCGAPNAREEMMALVALDGARLPGNRVIRKTEIQGVESQGMLCSGAEVGWNSEAEGILELPPDSPVGEPYDCLFDLKMTPNRPDCMSVFGIARDVAALEGRELYAPQARMRETMDPISAHAQVTVRDKKGCPRYAARMIRGVHIGESPLWLKRALESAGLRPINNVVDVTNYVLMEYGHPLHAFDLDKVVNKHIIVRMAQQGEKIGLLDGRETTLDAEDLVIADPDRPVALAGVMGGANTEIGSATINVLLESAYFDPVTIRRTSKRHDISTDSSYRFERGADIKQIPLSLNRATQLIKELAGGDILKGTIDVGGAPGAPNAITMNIPRACMILGCDLAPTTIADRLVHLGFETIRSDREQLVVRPPSYRVDVTRDVDLIEEIARVHGYDNVPESSPYLPARPFVVSMERTVRETLRRAVVAAGFWEVMNYSFIGRDLLAKCSIAAESLAEILNPLSQDWEIMRPSLLPGLLVNVGANQRRGNHDLQFFELGKTYARRESKTAPYVETLELGMAATGRIDPARWRGQRQEADFLTVKGALETVFEELGIVGLTAERIERSWLHPGRAAALKAGDETVAVLGEIHPNVIEAMELRGRVTVAQVSVESVSRLARFDKTVQLTPRYPGIERDIAVIVSREAEAGRLDAAIRQSGGGLLENARLFDLYEGDRIEKGKKSLAYSLSFRAPDRTLRDEEADKAVAAIVERLSRDFGAVLRSE